LIKKPGEQSRTVVSRSVHGWGGGGSFLDFGNRYRLLQ
jgi:hypothetical protein